MNRSLRQAGWPGRPALLVGLGALILLGAASLALAGGAEPARGPIAIPAPSGAAPERLLPDTVPPRRDVRLLWLAGRRGQQSGDSVLAVDADGGVLSVDARLRVRRLLLFLGGRQPTSVAAAPGGGLWLADAAGELLRVEARGRVLSSLATPFSYPELGGVSRSGEVWVLRSSERFTYQLDSTASPLLMRLTGDGAAITPIGRAIRPTHVLLSDLANAGHLAVGDEAVYYAPFIRDEVVALTLAGDTLWVSRRGLPQSTADPRFEVQGKRVVVDYHPVNLGIALGPDGRLYVLSTPGFTMTESRLDVLDPASGRLLRSASLATAQPTLAVDEEGRVYLLDPFQLLSGVPAARREPAPSFELPTLRGGQISSAALRGRVALLNFWASWCAPCRIEMPALDTLRRAVADSDFVFLAVNEEDDTAAARAFVAPFGEDFPVALGRGRMRERFHYPGLPYTVLLDRDGRIAGRWIGFAGPEQLQSIRALVNAELGRSGHRHGQHFPVH